MLPPANSKKQPPPKGRPWPKGVSGNPKGRPKSSLNKSLAKVLAERYPDAKHTNELELCRRVVAEAIEGDVDMRKLIWQRIEGNALTYDEQGTAMPPIFSPQLGHEARE